VIGSLIAATQLAGELPSSLRVFRRIRREYIRLCAYAVALPESDLSNISSG